MSIRDRLLDLERRLTRLAGASPPVEPLEVRQAILDAIADLTVPSGRARRVLPVDRVTVEVVAPTPERRRAFAAVLDRDGGLETAARRTLGLLGCEIPAGVSIEVRYRKRPGPRWGRAQIFHVSGRAVSEAGPVGEAGAGTLPAPATVAILKVVAGRPARKTLTMTSGRVNVGRQAEVFDRDRRLVRRNDLVFLEGEAMADSVSRAHAHISHAPATGVYRVHDDNSAYGTRIVRGGATIEVLAANARGVRILSGDELHFGRAVVRVELREETAGHSPRSHRSS
jgi:hypothetical protein